MKQKNADAEPAKPRLRFDRVAVGLMERVRSAVTQFAPNGATVLFAVTAPIRLPSKTAAAIEEVTFDLLSTRRKRIEEQTTIHGNGVCISIEKTASRIAPVVRGFVHNPETDARQLFDMTRNELAERRMRKR